MVTNPTADTQDFFEKRMALLGISNDMLDIELYTDSIENCQYHNIPNTRKEFSIFRANDKGIGILLYTIRGEVHWFRSLEGKQKIKEYYQTRLLHPKKRKDSSVQKYDIPKGQKTLPFFPPLLLRHFESGETIETLYLTEGHFKAFKATMHGILCVGLPSITCLRDKDGLMHDDIIALIKKCQVQRVVWLHDGDCRNITSKEITDQTDLSTRPYIFYKSVEAFYDLMSKEGVRLYFAHINSQEVTGNPKGIDDLLCSLNESEQQEAAKEFNDFRVQKSGTYTGVYLTRIDVTRSTRSVFQYFMLDNVDDFYHFHLEQRPELNDVQFKFFGTTYRYDHGSNKCVIVTPRSAANYFRVGDTYYQYVEIPDQWNTLIKTFERRERKTILEDNGKEIFEHIHKYTSFCNVPSHTDYQQVIHNCYNLYHPFDWQPSEEDSSCPHTLGFIKHIFGSESILLNVDDADSAIERWELGLDYLQLLFQKPQQVLPILCLISKERQTGKTTFGDWLKELYKENMAIVGNADLKSEFNAHWISKLIVMVDETKVDQEVVVERLKALSTAKSAIWNSKGKDQKSIPTFAKFILISNREEDFIRIDKHEIRFWVIRVPKLSEETLDVKLLRKMVDEIPSFLNYLCTRKIKAPEKERHWFESRLLVTEALQSIVAHSKITVEKQIEIALTELFESSGEQVITMPLTDLAALVKQQNKSYLSEVLNRMGYKSSEYPSSKYFPRISERRESTGEIHLCCEYVKFKGRFYTFNRKDFTASPEGIIEG